MSGHPDFDGPCQCICSPAVSTERHILLAGRATMQLTRGENAPGCQPRISRATSNAVTNFIRMSDATPPRPQTSACIATDWLSACHAICRPRVVTMQSQRDREASSGYPNLWYPAGSASRLNCRASTGYGSNFLVDVTGSQTRHTSSRGNVGAAEDLKRKKGK